MKIFLITSLEHGSPSHGSPGHQSLSLAIDYDTGILPAFPSFEEAESRLKEMDYFGHYVVTEVALVGEECDKCSIKWGYHKMLLENIELKREALNLKTALNLHRNLSATSDPSPR